MRLNDAIQVIHHFDLASLYDIRDLLEYELLGDQIRKSNSIQEKVALQQERQQIKLEIKARNSFSNRRVELLSIAKLKTANKEIVLSATEELIDSRRFLAMHRPHQLKPAKKAFIAWQAVPIGLVVGAIIGIFIAFSMHSNYLSESSCMRRCTGGIVILIAYPFWGCFFSMAGAIALPLIWKLINGLVALSYKILPECNDMTYTS